MLPVLAWRHEDAGCAAVFVDAVYSSLVARQRPTQSSDTHDSDTEPDCKTLHFDYAILLRVRVGASFQYSVQLGPFEKRVIKLEVYVKLIVCAYVFFIQ